MRHALSAVRVPTLVLHRRGDALFRVEEASYLAERIPSATLRLLDGADHLVCGDPDQILDQIEDFLQQMRTSASHPLSLVAVVAAAGQSEVIDDLAARGGLACMTPRGRRVVLFDGPATAVRCGLAGMRTGARLGVSIAEVNREWSTVDGPGVQHAERIADAAGDGELWVSAAAGMLLSGSGLPLEPVAHEDDTAGRPLLRVPTPTLV